MQFFSKEVVIRRRGARVALVNSRVVELGGIVVRLEGELGWSEEGLGDASSDENSKLECWLGWKEEIYVGSLFGRWSWE